MKKYNTFEGLNGRLKRKKNKKGDCMHGATNINTEQSKKMFTLYVVNDMRDSKNVRQWGSFCD